MGRILVGTASWTDKTLLASGWYPESANTAEKRLAYYARQFPLVEVDATYYSPPAESTAQLWVDRSPPGFLFNIKAFSLLTGHPTKVSAIYKDLRPETEKRNIYPDDLTPQAYEDVWTRFLSALPNTALPLCRRVRTSAYPSSVSQARRSAMATRRAGPRLIPRRKPMYVFTHPSCPR